MQAQIFFPAILLSFIGLFIGYFLAYQTDEEENDIKKYVKLSQFALILIFTIATSVMAGINFWIGALFAIMVGLTFFFIKVPSHLYYPILGVLTYFGSLNQDLFYVQTFLVFTIGITIGTFNYWDNKKTKWYHNYLTLFYQNISFIIIATILFFLF